MIKSAYIHIPFCKSKCHYCSFVSYTELDQKEKYLNALQKEIKYKYCGENLDTLYFGGGTPSVLTPEEFSRIINHFSINKDTEMTTELNPETLNYEYLSALLQCGVNRISLGCQTFNDDILKTINRRHNAQQVINAVKAAQKSGFKNISLDFIYGLPQQTLKDFCNDLNKAVELGIQHISLYGLTIEKGCYFASHLPEKLPGDDLQADMYLAAIELLTQKGFEHYEFSNFSLKGYNSQHNLTYWKNNEYYGFGVAAHGYINGIRYGNKLTVDDYALNPLEHFEEKIETQQEKLEEEIFLGFRIMSGLDVNKINRKYHIDFDKKYADILKKYIELKMIKKTHKGYALSAEGVLVSNTILADFLG